MSHAADPSHDSLGRRSVGRIVLRFANKDGRPVMIHRRWSLVPSLLVTFLIALAGCAAETAESTAEDSERAGEQASELGSDTFPRYVNAQGSFSCELILAGNFPPQNVPPTLERDRMIMSKQPGMLSKYLPIAFSTETSTDGAPDFLAGGRYLFRTVRDAQNYHHFVENEFFLDGVEFVDRADFKGHECHDWKVTKAYELSSVDTSQLIMRTERFTMSGPCPARTLESTWEAIRREATDRHMAAVWLLYNDVENLAQIVYYNDRIVPYDPNILDFASLGFVAGGVPLGHHLAEKGWARTFDRTQWVLTIWFPFVKGDHGKESLWPHSPPFGKPYCTDGVCEVSRGENSTTCRADCPVRCGDGRCQVSEGENDHNCPGDCGH